MIVRRLVPLAAAGALLLGLAGCSSPSAEPTGDAGTIPLTFITEVTGFASFYGGQGVAGVEFAVDEINANGGVDGSMIELTILDTASTPAEAANLASEAAGGDAVAVIFGVIGSEAQAIAPITQKAGLPTVFFESSAPGLVEIGDAIYHSTESGANYFPQLFDLAADELDVQTVDIVYSSDNSSAVAQVESATELMEESGLTLVNSIGVASADSDLSTVATRILTDDVDMVLALPSSSATASALIKDLRQLGYEGEYAGSTGLIGGALTAAGDAAEGTLYPAAFVASEELPWAEGVAFSKEFEAATGTQPNAFNAEARDAVYLVAEAIKSSGDISRAGVLAGLETVAAEGFTGATGDMTFTSRQASTPGVIIRWSGGRETLAAAGK